MTLDLNYYRMINGTYGLNNKREYDKLETKQYILDNFSENIAYENVKINDIDREVWIWSSSNELTNNSKELYISCKPDEIYNVGDLVEFGGIKYLIVGVNSNNRIKIKGKMQECNNILKFYDVNQNNILYEIPCIIVDKITTSLQENKFLLTIDCDILVMIANNDTNNLISPNDIFKIGRYSYYITKPDDISKTGLIILPMKFTEEMQEEYTDTSEINDDNYILTSESLPDNEIILTQTKVYEFNKYNNGDLVEQSFSFDVVGDNLSYQLTIIDGNSCSVKCLKSGSVITLKAIDDSNDEIVLKDIRLKNLF